MLKVMEVDGSELLALRPQLAVVVEGVKMTLCSTSGILYIHSGVETA